MNTLATGLKTVIFLGALALWGCLVSNEPLLDASNARAKPIRVGEYQMCSFSDGEPDDDCKTMQITLGQGQLYSLTGTDGETNTLRFKKVARRAWLTQLLGEDESEGYVYYLARGGRNKFTLTMMHCPDLPAEFRERMIESGEMETEEGGQICVVKSLGAVVSAAKLYARKDGPDRRYYIEFTKQ